MIDIHFDYSKIKGSTTMHNKFKNEFMVSVAKEFPDVMVLPYDVAFVRAYSEPERCFQVGQKGVLDTVVLGKNWYLFLDMKTGCATLQANQKDFVKRLACINLGSPRGFKINTVFQGLELIRKIDESSR